MRRAVDRDRHPGHRGRELVRHGVVLLPRYPAALLATFATVALPHPVAFCTWVHETPLASRPAMTLFRSTSSGWSL